MLTHKVINRLAYGRFDLDLNDRIDFGRLAA